jgi:hypothetical protein
MAANYKFTLKRNNGTDYDELYPKTVIAQVNGLQSALDAKVDDTEKGAVNGVATLGSDGKVPFSQLPSSVTGGMRFAGILDPQDQGAMDTLSVLASDQALVVADIGKYFIIAQTATDLAEGTQSGNYLGKWQSEEIDDGQDPTTTITLEAGDWIVVQNVQLNTPTSGVTTVTFGAINNTYRDATSSVSGIVTLSDGNGGLITGLTGNTVITEGNLIGMTYTAGTDLNGITSDKFARANHTHSQYQPVDTELTAIAGLATTDGNFIVGNGTTWVVESGATARTSLGLSIGTDVQAYDAGLASIAGLNPVADRYLYTTATDTFAAGTITSFGRSILDDADASAARTTLGLVIGTNVQAYDADLAAIAALTPTDNNIIVGNGTAWVAESGSTARTSLGLAIGTDVQAYSANLGAIAGLAVTDSNIIVGNGTTWVAESGATARASLGVYSTTEIDTLLTNRPEIFYNTTTGAGSGDLIIADVVAA